MTGWRQNLRYNQPGDVRQREATVWVPESKPIWFTEFGCAALDKATNQPNKFLDSMSSESMLPQFLNGMRLSQTFGRGPIARRDFDAQ